MDEYLTDQQLADRFKRWCKENGAFLVAGLVIGVGSLFGWRQWENYRLEQVEQASAVYEQLLLAIGGNRVNEATEQLLLLTDKYYRTPYVDQAQFAMAKMYMDRNSPEEAAAKLQLLLAESDNPQFQHIARLRLAKVRLHQGEYDAALASLVQGEPTAFAPQYHDIRGDVYFGMGRFDEARAEYESALSTAASGVIERVIVQAKLDDLGPELLHQLAPITVGVAEGGDSLDSSAGAAAEVNHSPEGQ